MDSTISQIPPLDVNCPLGITNSAEELANIHRTSVIRHAELLAGPQEAKTKIIAYFSELKTFLEENHYKGCPYSNAVASSSSRDKAILKEVRDHKEFIREFLTALCFEVATSERAARTGDLIFLLYSGATTESQNLKQSWPVESAIISVNDLLNEEEALRAMESAIG